MTVPHQPLNRDTTTLSTEGGGRAIPILLAIVLLSGGVMTYRAASLPCISRDGVFFVQFAGQLAEDPVFYMRAHTKQPGYSWMLLAAHEAGGKRLADAAPLAWERTGQLLGIGSGMLCVLLIFILTRALFDLTTGLAAAALSAVWTQAVYLSADVLSDMPHLAVYLAALCLVLRVAKRPSSAASILAGVVAGVGYLIRQESLGLPLAAALVLVWPNRATSLKRRLASAALIGLAFALTVAPYAIAVGKVMHGKTISDLLFGPPAVSSLSSLLPVQAGVVRWWTAPWDMSIAWARSGTYVLSTWALIGVLYGAAPRADRVGRRLLAIAAVLQIAAAQLRGTSFDVISDRYMLIPAALSIPWAASGMRFGLRRICGVVRPSRGGSRQPAPARWAALVIALGTFAASPMIYRCLRRPPDRADVMRVAGDWLRARPAPGGSLAGGPRLDRIAFYAEMDLICPDIPGAPPTVNAPTGTWFADLPERDEVRLPPRQRAWIAALRARVDLTEPDARFGTVEGRFVRVYQVR